MTFNIKDYGVLDVSGGKVNPIDFGAYKDTTKPPASAAKAAPGVLSQYGVIDISGKPMDFNAYQNIAPPSPIPVIPPNTPITSSSLAPTQAATVPPPPTIDTSFVGGMQTTLETMNQQIEALKKQQAEQAKTQAEGQGSDLNALFKQYLGEETPPSSAEARYNELYNKSDVAAKQQKALESESKYNALLAQLQGLKYQYETVIPQQLQQDSEGRGITEGGLAPLLAGAQRKKLLEMAPLQFEALIAQAEMTGNQRVYEAAQNHLDKIFDLQTRDVEARYKYESDLRERVYNFASDQEKRRLDAIAEQKKDEFTMTRDMIKYAQEIAKTAVENGQPDIAAKISALDPLSSSFAQDVAKLQGMAQVQQEVWSEPFNLGGDIVQKNLKTGEIRTAVNVPKETAPSTDQTMGSDLNDAYSAIQNGADPETVRRAFLQDHPSASSSWDNFFTSDGEITYPSREEAKTRPWWQFW